MESDLGSTFDGAVNKRLQVQNNREAHKRLGSSSSQYDKLPFQEGVPLKEDNTSPTQDPDRKIFMAIVSETEDHEDDPMGRVDLVDYNSSDYDKFLSNTEIAPTPT